MLYQTRTKQHFPCYLFGGENFSVGIGQYVCASYTPIQRSFRSWTRTHNHLLRKRTLNYLAKPAKTGQEHTVRDLSTIKFPLFDYFHCQEMLHYFPLHYLLPPQ